MNGYIDSVVRCVRCGLTRLECNCWITLSCPRCKRTQMVDRESTDGDAKILLVLCPECLDKDP